ncbi:MAG: hypothetical protein AAGA86_10815 [Bacteroidota bacterium]
MIKHGKKGLSYVVLATLFAITGLTAQTRDVTTVPEELDLATVIYIEDDEGIDLDFDTYFYLPKNFDPYKGMHFQLDEIIYLEVWEDLDLGSDVLLP